MKKHIGWLFLIGCAAALLLQGCGRTEIDLNDYLEIRFSGYDTVGTATAQLALDRMIADHPRAFKLRKNASGLEQRAVALTLGDVLDGSLDQTENLSNGDNVTYYWAVGDLTGIAKQYAVKLTYSDKVCTVSGLEQAEALDPFADVRVTFSGISPCGKAEVSADGKYSFLGFTADRSEGLRNGSKITVSVEAGGADPYEYCLGNGILLTKQSEQYTVTGLPAYVETVGEIPAASLRAMRLQGEAVIRAKAAAWPAGNTVQSVESLGCMLLTGNADSPPSPYDLVRCVYRVTAVLNGITADDDTEAAREETYYTYVQFSDVYVNPDGSCFADLTAGKLCPNQIGSTVGRKGYLAHFTPYTLNGYSSLRELKTDYDETLYQCELDLK